MTATQTEIDKLKSQYNVATPADALKLTQTYREVIAEMNRRIGEVEILVMELSMPESNGEDLDSSDAWDSPANIAASIKRTGIQ